MSSKWSWPSRKIPVLFNYWRPTLLLHFNHSFSICRAASVGSVSAMHGYCAVRVSPPGRGRSTHYPLTIFTLFTFCCDTVLTTHSPHLTFYDILFISLIISILLISTCMYMSKSSSMNCMGGRGVGIPCVPIIT